MSLLLVKIQFWKFKKNQLKLVKEGILLESSSILRLLFFLWLIGRFFYNTWKTFSKFTLFMLEGLTNILFLFFFVFSPVLAAIGLLTKRTKTYDEDDSCIAVWRNWEVYVVGIMFEATTFLPLLLDVVVDDDDDDEHWLEFPCRLYPYGDNV